MDIIVVRDLGLKQELPCWKKLSQQDIPFDGKTINKTVWTKIDLPLCAKTDAIVSAS